MYVGVLVPVGIWGRVAKAAAALCGGAGSLTQKPAWDSGTRELSHLPLPGRGTRHRVIQGDLCLDFAIRVFLGKYGIINARGSDFSLPLISGKYVLQAPSSGTVVCKQHGPEDMGQPARLEGSPAAGGYQVSRSGVAPATGSVMWEQKGGSTQSQKGVSACGKIRASCGLKFLKSRLKIKVTHHLYQHGIVVSRSIQGKH